MLCWCASHVDVDNGNPLFILGIGKRIAIGVVKLVIGPSGVLSTTSSSRFLLLKTWVGEIRYRSLPRTHSWVCMLLVWGKASDSKLGEFQVPTITTMQTGSKLNLSVVSVGKRWEVGSTIYGKIKLWNVIRYWSYGRWTIILRPSLLDVRFSNALYTKLIARSTGTNENRSYEPESMPSNYPSSGLLV